MNLAPYFNWASAFMLPYILGDTRPWHPKVTFDYLVCSCYEVPRGSTGVCFPWKNV